MFHRFHAGERVRTAALLSLALSLVVGLLPACGGDSAQSSSATQASSSQLVLDTGTAAPAQGDTMTLKATLLGADGQEVKGAKFAWSSSNEAVAVVVSASDLAPTKASTAPQVGTYAVVRLLAQGNADIIATATLPDGSQTTSTSHLSVQAAKTYTLSLSPSTLTVNNGSAPQRVTAVVQRSDGVDGAADLTGWSWTVDNNTFAMVPASDNHSAQVSTTGTLAGTGQLTACASTPAGNRLCANAALARPVVPLPSIALSATSLTVKPGRTGIVSATLTDAPGANLASQATLAWSIQQSGTAASIAGAANGASVTISSDSTQTAAYAATLTITATYPDGRTNSSTLPLSSPGVWSRLPDAPVARPSVTSLAIDGTRVWRLTADGSQPARLERFGVVGEAPREPAAALPAAAQGIWLAAATDPTNSAVMVQLGPDGSSVPFGSIDAELAGARTDVALWGCGATAGRAFVKTTNGTGIAATGWCGNTRDWSWQMVGGAPTVTSVTGPFATVISARPYLDGSGSLAIASNGAVLLLYPSGSTTMTLSRTSAPLSLGAVATGAADTSAPVYGYASSLGIVTTIWVNGYTTLWAAAPPLTTLSAIPHGLVGLSTSSFVLVNTDTRATTAVAWPASGTPTDFVSALDANGKLRIATQLGDGSVWVYDQP